MNKYKDIINMKCPTSKKHPRMSIEARSAQFAPFAALTGYSDAVKETARITNKKIEIDDGLKTMLDYKLQIINQNIKEKPEVEITYFEKDKTKAGGKYLKEIHRIKKIDLINNLLLTQTNKKIKINDIINLTSENKK